jgi:hypothetical protein
MTLRKFLLAFAIAIGLAVGSIVILVVAAVAFATFDGTRPGNVQQQSPVAEHGAAPPQPPAPEATPPTPAASRNVAMKAWSKDALPIVQAIARHMNAMSVAGKTLDLDGMTRGCRGMKIDARRLQAQLPSPDPAMNVQLGGALDDFTQAANRCISGVQTQDAEELQVAIELMQSGTRKLSAASDVMDTYTR